MGHPLAFNGWRSRALLDILQHTGQPEPAKKIIKFQMSAVLKGDTVTSEPCRSRNSVSQPFHSCLVKDKPPRAAPLQGFQYGGRQLQPIKIFQAGAPKPQEKNVLIVLCDNNCKSPNGPLHGSVPSVCLLRSVF